VIENLQQARVFSLDGTTFTRTLARAMQTAGSRQQLAMQLKVSEESLQSWLDGVATPPIDVYLAALDVVARGPFGHKPNKQQASN
jgi:hypothetical protein